MFRLRHDPEGHTRASTRLRRIGGMALAAVAAAAACVHIPTEPTFEPNVMVFGAAQISQTDEALLVAGTPHIDFGDGIRSIFLSHQIRYVYRGVFDHLTNDREMDESWYMDFRRSRVIEQRADTLFRRAVDFGDVTLDGTLADRLVSTGPIVVPRGDHFWAFDGYLTFRASVYSYRSVLNGSDVSFRHEPAYDNIRAGRAVRLAVSGTSEVEAASASFRVRSGPRVVELWNGETLDFRNTMPALRYDQPLMLQVDRPIDPDRAIIRIFYVPPDGLVVTPEQRQLASAAFMLFAQSDEIVIPGSALREIASHLPEAVGQFIIQISEYLVDPDVMQVRYGDGEEESFDVMRASSFRIYATIAR